jgi:dihydroxyacid dehydratase/phosphogluconate dehydratase
MSSHAILSDRIRPGYILVLRYLDPKGGPGMPEMRVPTCAINGHDLGDGVGLITNSRFSGGTWGMVAGYVAPGAFDGRTIALVREGDLRSPAGEQSGGGRATSAASLANLPCSRAQPTKEPARVDAAGRHIQRGAYAAPRTSFLGASLCCACIQSAIPCALLAAVKMARLSERSTSSQEAI